MSNPNYKLEAGETLRAKLNKIPLVVTSSEPRALDELRVTLKINRFEPAKP